MAQSDQSQSVYALAHKKNASAIADIYNQVAALKQEKRAKGLTPYQALERALALAEDMHEVVQTAPHSTDNEKLQVATAQRLLGVFLRPAFFLGASHDSAAAKRAERNIVSLAITCHDLLGRPDRAHNFRTDADGVTTWEPRGTAYPRMHVRFTR